MRFRKKLHWLSNPYLPIAVFTAFTLGGCLYIVIAKQVLGVGPFISMAVPIILMLAYLGLSKLAGKLRLHDEQTGDNLYYMGFLFTLTSLGVSLYQFSSDGSTDTVVKNFGIAISSTIAGIALRILYNQMRRDPADIERAARHELADMSRRVRTEMENVTREFADFRRVSHQMLEEGFEEIANQAEKNGEHIRKILDKMAMEAIKPVQDASVKLGGAMLGNFSQIEGQFSDIAKRVETAGELLDKANSAMSTSVDRLGIQADVVAAKLERVVVPEEVLKNDLAPMVKALGDAVARYAVKTETASAEQQSRMADISKTVQGIAEDNAKAVQVVAENSARAATAAERTAEAAANQQRLTEALVRVVQKQSQDTTDLVGKLLANSQPKAPERPQQTAPEFRATPVNRLEPVAYREVSTPPPPPGGTQGMKPAPEPAAAAASSQPLDTVLPAVAPAAAAEASWSKWWGQKR
ncbi:hypothetical protein [Mesorhizobium sp. M5C.F.Ca.ET.164.01.1.1]|nr:hypothetical protein [Mesorhizobium sp. M5C.F.Ca.ET.164.01.1.1]TGT93124.1 hypothetical protein EN807_28230 [Mesorhizobium sp. M5C.F.Ca.ET.164.01.1.1]